MSRPRAARALILAGLIGASLLLPTTVGAQSRDEVDRTDQVRDDALSRLIASNDALDSAADHLLETGPGDKAGMLAGATPFLRLLGTVAGGWMMARSVLVADRANDPGFRQAKRTTARFYAEQLLPAARAHLAGLRAGGAAIMGLDEAHF